MSGRRYKDLTNKIFGKWKVINLAHTNKRNPFWNCICECGTKREVSSNSLRNGSNSCGDCGSKRGIRVDHDIDHELKLIAKNVMARYVCEAKKRNLTFELNFEYFWDYINNNCFYCDKKPSSLQTGKRKHKLYYNGIDRVDNSLGYNVNNCVSCCKTCNIKKMSITKNMIEKAYKFLFLEKLK